MRHIKRFHCILALLLTACMLGGCANQAQVASQSETIILPEPSVQPDRMILGDSSVQSAQDVTLYYAEGSSGALTTVTRTIHVGQNESLAEKAVQELLRTSSGNGLRVTSTDTRLLNIENSCGVVTVNLSIDAGARQSEQDYLYLCATIGNTLLGLPPVEGVNILIGGRSDALCELPVGTITENISHITAAYAQYNAENTQFIRSGTGSITRNVTLYFPSTSGEYLLPETRTLSFDSADYARGIVEALRGGPQSEASFSAIPGNLDIFAGSPVLRISSAGERILELNLSSMLTNYLAFSGIEAWQLYGSIVLSLTTFVPELDAVRICIDGQPIQSCQMDSGLFTFEDGMVRRDDFVHKIGSSAQMYFADASGRLMHAEYAVSQAEAQSAKRILSAMIEAEYAGAQTTVFPDGVFSEDILGVAVENNVALVNLSGNFYSRCQQFDANEERNLIYAMVNTLCCLDQIGAVRFLVEGKTIETLAGSIYLKTALLPNPGLVVGSAQPDGGISQLQ